MKTILTISFLLILFSKGYSQYESIFGKYQTSWKITACGCMECCAPDSVSVLYNADTIISNKLFKKVIPLFLVPPNSEFYLSEDTTTGEVWFKGQRDTSVYKIMDMSLSSNDTFKLYSFYSESFGNYVVDSVYYLNNRKHIQIPFYVNNISGKYTMIEGVGPNVGTLPYRWIWFECYLLCQQKDSVNTYLGNSHPRFTCSSLYTGINDVENDKIPFTIYPNPLKNTAHLQINSQVKVLKMELIDIAGREVKEFQPEQRELHFELIEPGIYFLRMETNEGLFSRKLVVQ